MRLVSIVSREKSMPQDPREQAVESDAIDALAAKMGRIDPADFAPPHLLALRGELPAAHCAACGEPNALHYDTTATHFIGCDNVPVRRRLKELIARPLGNLTEWHDDHPKVSSAVLDTLRAACGPAMAITLESLDYQGRIDVARRVANIAVLAHLREEAGK